MKKKLLFITQYLQTGGVEKSLLTLLTELDYEKYEVDLLLFDHSGVLYNEVPKEVKILPPLFETFSTPLAEAIPKLLKKGRFRILTGKLLAGLLGRMSKGMGTGIRWSIYRHSLSKTKQHYDVAISYLDFFCNYYVIEKVSAKKKIIYNHMDYEFSQKYGWPCPKLDRRSFSKSDFIVTVAESSRLSLESYYPEFSNKIHVIHNRIQPKAVRVLSKKTPERIKFKQDMTFKIVTVARLVEEKGVLLALQACKILVEKGYDIIWYLIGNGPLVKELEKEVKVLGIEKNFILLGEQSNPYPFMGICDVYVQPSKTEAHCVAVEEAIALYRPVIVTDIPSFQNQIENGKTGIIVKANPEGIASGVERLFNFNDLRKEISNNLLNLEDRNKEGLIKFYQLIDG
ncbi:glycosyltransferase [Bacillus sp. OK048]|uniref:glycosyltransferase n=1 Tax=Bacillus sp. OK048 TaxID=1882761 RepID=UPI000886854F|nr:glycosyltransferase [Bacillus sp. OK048]SDM77925.1 Glycosyltransferase involved in cell wall bisynthesis [Bacillus sp. OK048]